MIIAGVAIAGLLLLFLRSRSSPAAPTAGTGTQAQQDAAAQAAAAQQAAASQQAANTAGAGTFADNGAQAASLGDAVTQGLSGVQSALQSLQQPGPGGAGGDPTAAAPANSITINNGPGANPPGHPAKKKAKLAHRLDARHPPARRPPAKPRIPPRGRPAPAHHPPRR